MLVARQNGCLTFDFSIDSRLSGCPCLCFHLPFGYHHSPCCCTPRNQSSALQRSNPRMSFIAEQPQCAGIQTLVYELHVNIIMIHSCIAEMWRYILHTHICTHAWKLVQVCAQIHLWQSSLTEKAHLSGKLLKTPICELSDRYSVPHIFFYIQAFLGVRSNS